MRYQKSNVKVISYEVLLFSLHSLRRGPLMIFSMKTSQQITIHYIFHLSDFLCRQCSVDHKQTRSCPEYTQR